jgi:hypothetical protein
VPTIADFKQRYPQFADMAPENLARELHTRFYSDLPYEDFMQEVLPARGEESQVDLLGVSEGLDLTAGTGVSAKANFYINQASDLANEVFGTDIPAMSQSAEELIPALDALSTIATTEMMKTISGKENLQLQLRLQKLQVPSKSFIYNDRRSLNQFKTASRTMDFAGKLLLEKLESGELDRKQIIKTKRDLSSARALQREYDKLTNAYERKMGIGMEEEDEDLDRFFTF